MCILRPSLVSSEERDLAGRTGVAVLRGRNVPHLLSGRD